MRPIYFVNRVMTPLEKDYTMIEQMVMALMFAVGRFRSYLLPKKFVILTVEDTFSLVYQHMDVSARISKWLVRLQEFEYTVQVENSTRASLAGMLTHRCYERKVKVKALGPEPVEVQAKLSGAHSLYFDGAYKRKVDKASVGISIQDENGQKVFGKGLLVENTHSNNEAEYAALALGLEWCVSIGIKRLNVLGDALLLIKQVHGTWACCNQSLVPRLRRVKELIRRFEAIQLYHVPRKGNQEADALASEQLQEVIVGAVKLQKPLFQGSDCMHDIVNFLETGKFPQDMSKGQRQWLVLQVENSTRASLAGMLTHGCYERKVKVKALGPEPVEVQAKLSGAHSLYSDGAYKRKVDKASVGISIQDENGQKVFGKGLLVENTHSNNEAEYAALALGLEWCVKVELLASHHIVVVEILLALFEELSSSKQTSDSGCLVDERDSQLSASMDVGEAEIILHSSNEMISSTSFESSCILWLNKKQPTVAASSCEAEYRAIFTAIVECVWLRRLMADLGVGQDTIYTNSQSALAIARNPIFHACTKHIEVHYHYVRERLSAEEISLAYMPTQDNLVDLLTKALSRDEKLEAFHAKLWALPFVN
ncbi:hypothetical protein L7F22_024260 [Adiantum nelumboides]|nr:hypothetical protein [Adiantum nelumboides]